MTTVLKFLLCTSSKELFKLLTVIFDAIKQLFYYKKCKQQNEKHKEQTKIKQNYEKKVDVVVDKGTIDDLLDLQK